MKLHTHRKYPVLAAAAFTLLLGSSALVTAAERVGEQGVLEQGLFERDREEVLENRAEMAQERYEKRAELLDERADEASGIVEQRAEKLSDAYEERAEALDESEGEEGLLSAGASEVSPVDNDVDQRSNRFNGPLSSSELQNESAVDNDVDQRWNRFNGPLNPIR